MTHTADKHLLLPSLRFAFCRNADRARQPSQQELQVVKLVQRRAAQLESASDRELRNLAATLKDAVQQFGGKLPSEDLATQRIAGAALVREAVRRTCGLRYHGVQILAGLALTSGNVAEMATGEGKTIISAIPAFFAWLDGRQTHVVTPNEYLAARDCEQLKPALELLGASVTLLSKGNQVARKQAAYRGDVVYGTGHEFGFDYLRDQLTLPRQRKGAAGSRRLDSLRGQASPAASVLQSRREL
ncbi:MAG TPA: DEAD/DEAH box helicase, partial [Planctomycetaceae bacterium]|nr:DEAD/DEAH box helicase [Planctomycetaceae bacterium]